MGFSMRLARHGIDITQSDPQLPALVSRSIHRSESRRAVSVRDLFKIHFLNNLGRLLLKKEPLL
jgi:hypothetical protein